MDFVCIVYIQGIIKKTFLNLNAQLFLFNKD